MKDSNKKKENLSPPKWLTFQMDNNFKSRIACSMLPTIEQKEKFLADNPELFSQEYIESELAQAIKNKDKDQIHLFEFIKQRHLDRKYIQSELAKQINTRNRLRREKKAQKEKSFNKVLPLLSIALLMVLPLLFVAGAIVGIAGLGIILLLALFQSFFAKG